MNIKSWKYGLLAISVLLYSFEKKGNEDPVKVITIMKTNMSMERITTISCDRLYQCYPFDTFYFFEREKQQKMLRLLNESTFTGCSCNIDARARIFITHESGRTDSICMGYSSVFSFNGRCMELPRRDLINMLIEMDRSTDDWHKESNDSTTK